MPLFYLDIWRHQLRAMLFYYGLLPLAVFAPGVLLDRLLGLPRLPASAASIGAAIVILLCGVGLIWWSTVDLQRRGGGTPSPLRPTNRLIMEGSYGLCRHPMFLGYDLVLLAVALLLCSLATLLVCYPFFLVWSVTWLRREERILARRFRDSYDQYRREVPFLLPRWRRSSQ